MFVSIVGREGCLWWFVYEHVVCVFDYEGGSRCM